LPEVSGVEPAQADEGTIIAASLADGKANAEAARLKATENFIFMLSPLG
jgi:hypothetical protein